MLVRIGAATALIILAAPALATETSASAAQDGATAAAAKDQAKPKERKICTRETETGSIVPKRVCRTVSEAQQANAQAIHDLEQMKTATQHGGSRN